MSFLLQNIIELSLSTLNWLMLTNNSFSIFLFKTLLTKNKRSSIRIGNLYLLSKILLRYQHLITMHKLHHFLSLKINSPFSKVLQDNLLNKETFNWRKMTEKKYTEKVSKGSLMKKNKSSKRGNKKYLDNHLLHIISDKICLPRLRIENSCQRIERMFKH